MNKNIIYCLPAIALFACSIGYHDQEPCNLSLQSQCQVNSLCTSYCKTKKWCDNNVAVTACVNQCTFIYDSKSECRLAFRELAYCEGSHVRCEYTKDPCLKFQETYNNCVYLTDNK